MPSTINKTKIVTKNRYSKFVLCRCVIYGKLLENSVRKRDILFPILKYSELVRNITVLDNQDYLVTLYDTGCC